MNPDDASLPLIAIFFGCSLAIIFAFLTFICLKLIPQIKKKSSFGFILIKKRPVNNDLNIYLCEYCSLYCKELPCNCICGCISNNTSNSLSNNDQDLDSANYIIYECDSKKNIKIESDESINCLNYNSKKEKLKNDISNKNQIDVKKDEKINKKKFNSYINVLSYKLEDTQKIFTSLENFNQKKKVYIKRLSFDVEKSAKIFLNTKKSMTYSNSLKTNTLKTSSLKTNSLKTKTIKKPLAKSKRIIPLLRRASINVGLVRQKSFDLTEEEISSCQSIDYKDISFNKKRFKNKSFAKLNNFENMKSSKMKNQQNQTTMDDSFKISGNEFIIKEKTRSKSLDSLHEDNKTIWNLRATFEEALSKENSNYSKENISQKKMLEQNTKKIIQPSIDSKLIKNDSGYKSLDRKSFSIDLKTEHIYRQSLTSISSFNKDINSQINQNNGIFSNLDMKNQLSIKEESEIIEKKKIFV